MKHAVSKSIEALASDDVGWVNRRDAAVELGATSVEAIRSLKAHQKDDDRDVRQSVLQSLKSVKSALAGLNLDVPTEGLPSLEKMVTALQKDNRREVSQVGDAFQITVATNNDRSQKVRVEATTSNTNRDVIRVSTLCAKATDKTHEWALTNNAHMSHCSLALETIDNEPWLVLVNNLLADTLSYAELKLTVKEVAFYGDWVEEKLVKEDVH